MALRHAETILGWHENRMPKDIPPSWMWPYGEELDRWFKNNSGDDSSDDSDDDRPEDTDNEWVRDRMKQMGIAR